jgi:parallel beta-helix repeat protein
MFTNGWRGSVRLAGAVCGLLAYGWGHGASAATLCVGSAGKAKCYTTIGAAMTAAAPGDTISIATGEYTEMVTITKPVSLVGAGASSTVINAHGQANGIYVDGLDNPGLANVTISGLTVMNANFEGILVTSASNVLIANNHVTNNDQALNYAAETCPGIPAFETSEGEDCGEGVHLAGAFAVTVANNVVDLNSGGILLSDETGPTYENYIVSNNVHDNAFDCGITLASHSPAPQTGAKGPFGVFSNSIVGNTSSNNGRVGAGAGVGIFAPGPGNLAFSNKVIGNTIVGNGQAGVAMHNHAAPPGAPAPNLNGNLVLRNLISGNGADTADAATPGTAGVNVYSVAPVYDTQIVENTIQNQDIGVVMNNPGGMEVHLNNLLGSGMGIDNLGKGTVNANLNFFGCAAGPGTAGCSTVSGPAVNLTVWLSSPVGSAPAAPARMPLQ